MTDGAHVRPDPIEAPHLPDLTQDPAFARAVCAAFDHAVDRDLRILSFAVVEEIVATAFAHFRAQGGRLS